MITLFSDQTILVTGASGGLGGAIARVLSEQGATVCLSGRNLPRLRATARRLSGGEASCYPADLTRAKDLRSVVKKVMKDHGRLDALIHCAAIIVLGQVATGTGTDFDRQFKTNVIAPFTLTQLFLPALISSCGQVLFVNSSAGLKARAGVSQYAATKHALRALADSLREECNSSGVRVCSLFLGATATPMQTAIRAQQPRRFQPDPVLQPTDVADFVAHLLALPRTAEVTDVVMRPMIKT